jgi:raffinose/stachyose/melibiose transport system permease protein
MMYFKGQFTTHYPRLSAGVLISIMPVIIVYLFLQRYFVSGITLGGLKE